MLRLYDAIEGDRHFGTGDGNMLLVLDEGDPALLDGVLRVVHEECRDAATADPALLDTWLERRNDVSALHTYIEQGAVVDTMEIAATWSALPDVYEAVLAALRAVPDLAWRRRTSRTRTPTARASTSPSAASRRKSSVKTSTAGSGTRP